MFFVNSVNTFSTWLLSMLGDKGWSQAELARRAGVDSKSPHKIRHGHGVYGLKRAKTMDEYKAMSMNMMHESVATTDKTYSVLLNEEVADIISTFKPD